MKMWVKKMNKHGMHLLNPGEVVESAAPSQASGSMNGTVARQVGGLVGAAVHAAMNKKSNDPSPAGGTADTMPTGDAVYVITDQRLAAISYTALAAKPEELVGSYRYEQLAGIELNKGRLASAVTLKFDDGSEGTFEVPRMAKPEKFVDALRAKIG